MPRIVPHAPPNLVAAQPASSTMRPGCIDVQLTRRHDLVPQRVAAVQGYADHERAERGDLFVVERAGLVSGGGGSSGGGGGGW